MSCCLNSNTQALLTKILVSILPHVMENLGNWYAFEYITVERYL